MEDESMDRFIRVMHNVHDTKTAKVFSLGKEVGEFFPPFSCNAYPGSCKYVNMSEMRVLSE